MTIVDIVSPLALIVLAGAALAITMRRALKLWRAMMAGAPDATRSGSKGQRIKGVVVYVLGQGRLLRWPLAGIMHAFIFWGFIVLLTAIAEAIVEALYVPFNFALVPLAPVLAWFQDIFCLLVLTGVAFALINRLVFSPIRFRGSHKGDAVLILCWIGALLTAMELNYATRIAQGSADAMGADRPVAHLISLLFGSLSAPSEALVILHGIFFWVHLSLVFSFMVYLGYSKHLHIVTAGPNIYLRNLGARTALTTPDLEADVDHYGASKLEHFTWKDTLDLYSCTECGRCQTHCPSFNTGKPLSPKTLITDLRDAAYEKMTGGVGAHTHGAHQVQGPAEGATAPAPMWQTIASSTELPGAFAPSWIPPQSLAATMKEGEERPLIGGVIAEDTLWACTTCGACMDECPVLIDHVPKIIEMRRSLVLEEGRLPKQAEAALRNIETNANPYGIAQSARSSWADGLDVPRLADHTDAEYLYWVGCAASYDDRAKDVARSLVKILVAANVDFAILGNEEKCTGDPARRIGNEYLYQERAKENVALLHERKVRKIITTCPHCFNSIHSEYPDLGGDFEVVHHTQLIEQLLDEGKLTLEHHGESSITYHDSCYLGRWNGVYAPPRSILERIPGLTLLEMSRNRTEGMCCGAGGGRMWMEEDAPRINRERVSQAVETGATAVATACPFCLTMFDEGIGADQASLQVDDVAVYVARALASPTPVPGEALGTPSVEPSQDEQV